MRIRSSVQSAIVALTLLAVFLALALRSTGSSPSSAATDRRSLRDRAVPSDSNVTRLAAARRIALREESESTPPYRSELSGLVLEESGAPAVDATVVLSRNDAPRVPTLGTDLRRRSDIATTRSGARGEFAFEVDARESYDLRANHAGYVSATASGCTAESETTLILERTASLRVVAKDEGGRAVPGVALRFWRTNELATPFDFRVGTTNEQGAFVFGALATGPFILAAEHETLAGPPYIENALEKPGETRLTVVLASGESIRGRVTCAETGVPIAGASVGAGWTLARAVRTDASGRFHYLGWTGDGVRELHVVASGFGRSEALVGDRDEIDFELAPAFVVVGDVELSGGEPARGANVSAIGRRWTPEIDKIAYGSTLTDEDGRFQIRDLRRDASYTISIAAKDSGLAVVTFDPPPEGVDRVSLPTVVLPRGFVVSGSAHDRDGRPLEGRMLTLRGRANGGDSRSNSGARPSRSANAHSGIETCRIDSRGQFRFPFVSPGRYEAFLQLDGAPTLRRSIVVMDSDVHGLVLEPEFERSFRVLVTKSNGDPILGASVELTTEPGDRIRSRTDPSGSAHFRFLPPGRRGLRVRAPPEFLPFDTVAHDGATETTVELSPARIAAGIVLDGSDEPIPQIELLLISDDETSHIWTDRFGRFSARTGADVVTLRVSGRKRVSTPARMTFESTRLEGGLLEISLPADDLVIRAFPTKGLRAVRVELVTDHGEPLSNALVRVSDGSRSNAKSATYRSDANGAFELSGVREEEILLDVLIPKGHERITIRPEGDGVVRVRIPAQPGNGRLRGE